MVYLGIAFLSLASLSHLFEHWETVALHDCHSPCEHSHASSHPESNDTSHTHHHHSCSPHEHSPAILQAHFLFLPQPIVLSLPADYLRPPSSIPQEIDKPPRIS
jgi:hypothetical protein